MKWIYNLVFLATLTSQISYGQFVHVHTHINNNDQDTRTKLFALSAELGIINAELEKIKNLLKDTKKNHRNQLDLQYKKNKYDKKNSFIASAMTSTALSFGTDMMSNSIPFPYMTKEKQAYLRDVSMNKLVLSALQFVEPKKIKSSRRQEIYRLRSTLLREYSKIDRDARSLLYLPVGGLMITKYKEFSEMIKVLNALEIAL